MRVPKHHRLALDREVTFQVQRFLDSRLNEHAALLWAAALTSEQEPEREAVSNVLTFNRSPIREPYLSGWRLILESWKERSFDTDMKPYEIAETVRKGVAPGFLVDDVVDLVRPKLVIDPSDALRRLQASHDKAGPSRRVEELLPVRLTADNPIRLESLGFGDVRTSDILEELVDRLEAAIVAGLHWASRLGSSALAASNWIARVYHFDGVTEDDDPDRFRGGFAPVAKLYSEALRCLSEVNAPSASNRLSRLYFLDWPLTRRLWAAGAQIPLLVAPETLAKWLQATDANEFWNSYRFPEIAELRAHRFGSLAQDSRDAIEARLRRRPPKSFYRRDLRADHVERLRTEAAVSELRRLIAGGGQISRRSAEWLAAQDTLLGQVVEVPTVQHGLFKSGRYLPTREGIAYAPTDELTLIPRLEGDLTDRPYIEGRSALDYVTGNASTILHLLSRLPDQERFPRVWSALAIAQRDVVIGSDMQNVGAELRDQAEEFLSAAVQLPLETVGLAAEGIAYWLDGWTSAFGEDPRFRQLWLSTWPGAVTSTNQRSNSAVDDAPEFLHERDPGDDLASASLNTPVGRMMSAFLALLPSLTANPRPFKDRQLRAMRDAVATAEGSARQQAMHRMLMALGYMRRADQRWADEYLVPLLTAADNQHPELWDAISRIGVPHSDTMILIGSAMIRAAREAPIAAETRARLAERVVFAMLRGFSRGEDTGLDAIDIQQMLRRGGDPVRVRSAAVLSDYLGRKGTDAAAEYRAAVQRFIREVWPRDTALRSASISDRLASIPARASTAFSTAVDDLEHLLVPFDAWSLWEYRLYGHHEDERVLLYPNNAEEANALLKLLDRTIGNSETAVVPRDLARALECIGKHAPNILRDPRFARLSSLGRR